MICSLTLNVATHRMLHEIRPEDFSASYKRLVKRDFSEDVDDYSVTNVSAEQEEDYKGLFDLLTRVNMTRDSMDEDEDSVIPWNFTEIGCILLQFDNALMKHMVSSIGDSSV
jgi:hypothetical protein